jgi:hypothetical protein
MSKTFERIKLAAPPFIQVFQFMKSWALYSRSLLSCKGKALFNHSVPACCWKSRAMSEISWAIPLVTDGGLVTLL